MAYVSNLGNGQQVYIENQGTQTVITMVSSSPGQQQQASTGFSTATWTAPPTLFRTVGGFILRIQTAQGQQFVKLQGTTISTTSNVPSLTNAEVVPMEEADSKQGAMQPMPPMQPMQPMEPMQPMQPMPPMPPMKMGDMEMRMNPMEMRMGNMSASMGNPPQWQSDSRFCSQCGLAVKAGDRFCSNCGQRLD